MNIKELMSGIGVVIDDAFSDDGSTNSDKDRIFELVENIEKTWEIPFHRCSEIPSDDICNNLLQSASFVLLDWKLWQEGAPTLERNGIEHNIKFLAKAKDYFVPIFIFTNENESDVVDKIRGTDIYDAENPDKNFIFIKNKIELMESGFSKPIENWLKKNASVYILKTWEKAFYKAKRNLFGSMYEKSPDWPKVFWNSYKDGRKDAGVDLGSSMMTLINDSLLGRIKSVDLDKKVFSGNPDVPIKELQSVMEEVSFIKAENLDENEIKSGNLFKIPRGKYLLNIRPDCDCIPRNGNDVDQIELYCLVGKTLTHPKRKEKYNETNGNFDERISEAIVFPVDGGKAIRFGFNTLQIKKFCELKDQRIGTLIHPYITKIQQRYALYLQRQGLPRIPKESIFEATQQR